MNLIFRPLALLPFLVFAALSVQAQTSASAEQFSFLTGNWQSPMGKDTFYETWTRTGPNQYAGKGYLLAKGDTAMREVLRLEKIGPHWVYIAAIDKQQPTLFTLVEATPEKLVFENKEHNFPQRICYAAKPDGSMLAWIEGKLLGKVRKEEYPMTRVK